MRYFIRLSYDGSSYHGWQAQKNALSVQNVLSEAFSLILREKISLTGCGRTDAGVHAREYFAHFDLAVKYDEKTMKKTVFKLNGYLGKDIAVSSVFPVKEEAHARFSAILRTYKYYISLEKDPFQVKYSWYHYGLPDLSLMNRGAALIMQYSDFTSFSKVDTETKTRICRITEAVWEKNGNQLVFTISADRFLRNMVRAIVGTLIDLGTGKMTLRDLKLVIEARNRSDAGESVPACGLFLERIVYPEKILTGIGSY